MLDSVFRVVGYGLCHQLPERSFIAGGHQLPVCARDTGIYAGFVLGLLALWVLTRGRRPTEPPRWPMLAVLGVFIASMAYDGLTSYAGLRNTTNDIRLVTGFVTGWALSTLTVPMLNSQLFARSGSGRVLDGPGQSAGWFVLLAAGYAFVRWVMPITGVFYPVAVTAAIVVTFVSVNLVLVGLAPSFERKAARLRDAWIAMVLAGVLTVLELGVAAWIRVLAERVL